MPENLRKITVEPNGPYRVQGDIPLVRKSPVMSEYGEPLTWKKDGEIPAPYVFFLCRCGQSRNKPFCDESHEDISFDGSEAADAGSISGRASGFEGTGITIQDDRSLCMHAGFCGTRITNVWKMIQETEDKQIRAQIMAMIERCPSGALSYAVKPEGEVVEPDLLKEVALTPDGPIWVSGSIPIERSDGQALEIRNRVPLCICGASKMKPLCDCSHKEIGFSSK